MDEFSSFCEHCKSLGHSRNDCVRLHPHLAKDLAPRVNGKNDGVDMVVVGGEDLLGNGNAAIAGHVVPNSLVPGDPKLPPVIVFDLEKGYQ
ncbi:hypothetical protein IEQ34_012731 [Dendrobium chrysotoxum]|uniref:Uncharacterized protein n=1 Tax=Dendrobium chrysotoxum TaxID=161865 RepID=A0AAV7GMP2_DENCH|nr:hypothetical protein IEQ34_012731 [Dendrobium chrysotoxum]